MKIEDLKIIDGSEMSIEDLQGAANSRQLVGLYSGISHLYHQIKNCASKSGLDQVNKSPAHYGRLQKRSFKPTDEMQFGSAVHFYFEGKEAFRKNVAVSRRFDLRKKGAKEEQAEFLKSCENKIVIDYDKLKKIARMKISAMANDLAREILTSPGVAEVVCFWIDPVSGEQCKAMLDWVCIFNGQLIWTDIKTSKDASIGGFAQAFEDYRYDVQAAFYSEGFFRATGVNPVVTPFIVIEKEESNRHVTVVQVPTAEQIERGREDFRVDLDRYAKYARSKSWFEAVYVGEPKFKRRSAS